LTATAGALRLAYSDLAFEVDDGGPGGAFAGRGTRGVPQAGEKARCG